MDVTQKHGAPDSNICSPTLFNPSQHFPELGKDINDVFEGQENGKHVEGENGAHSHLGTNKMKNILGAKSEKHRSIT